MRVALWKIIDKSETQHMLRGNNAATLLKIVWKKLYSVKCYDKSNMNVITLSPWENFRWGFIHIDQFIRNTGPEVCLSCCKHSDGIFILLINVKTPTVVAILTFMSRINLVELSTKKVL